MKQCVYGIARRCLLGALCCAIGACSGERAFDPRAPAAPSWSVMTQRSNGLDLEVVEPSPQPRDAVLWVFIEGDGSPWIRRTQIAADPSPRNALAFDLFRLSDSRRVYLGRPCYFGHAGDAACDASLWTSHRYGDAVVESMTAALAETIHRCAAHRVVLVGYSGGGAIAYLLASRIPEVAALVTVAGNLDTDAWTHAHGYLPLSGSRNPRAEPALARRITQIVLIAGRDANVPAATLQDFLAKERPQYVWTFPRYDHVCCWRRDWPAILERIDAVLERRGDSQLEAQTQTSAASAEPVAYESQ